MVTTSYGETHTFLLVNCMENSTSCKSTWHTRLWSHARSFSQIFFFLERYLFLPAQLLHRKIFESSVVYGSVSVFCCPGGVRKNYVLHTDVSVCRMRTRKCLCECMFVYVCAGHKHDLRDLLAYHPLPVCLLTHPHG